MPSRSDLTGHKEEVGLLASEDGTHHALQNQDGRRKLVKRSQRKTLAPARSPIKEMEFTKPMVSPSRSLVNQSQLQFERCAEEFLVSNIMAGIILVMSSV